MKKEKLHKKTPRKDQAPRKVHPSKALGRELTAWDAEYTDCDGESYIEFRSLDEFRSYMSALGESLEIDPEGLH